MPGTSHWSLDRTKPRKDLQHHAIDRVHHVRVRETQDRKSPPRQMRITFSVRSPAVRAGMLDAIELDNKPLRKASEVDNEIIDRHLTAEVEALSAQPLQLLPEMPFYKCLVPA
jgi:hypothetical protein